MKQYQLTLGRWDFSSCKTSRLRFCEIIGQLEEGLSPIFDTGTNYGNEAEKLRQAIADSNTPEMNVQVTTKVGFEAL